jgi:hypothetical protein
LEEGFPLTILPRNLSAPSAIGAAALLRIKKQMMINACSNRNNKEGDICTPLKLENYYINISLKKP